jgi:hypothetical protein
MKNTKQPRRQALDLQNAVPTTVPNTFDLFRLSKSKEAVDCAPNTIRTYHKQGLPIYKMGKSAFVSRTEVFNFIRSRGAQAA